MFSFDAESFSCSVDVLYGVLEIFIKNINFFSCLFFNFRSSKPWIRIGWIHLKCWIRIRNKIQWIIHNTDCNQQHSVDTKSKRKAYRHSRIFWLDTKIKCISSFGFAYRTDQTFIFSDKTEAFGENTVISATQTYIIDEANTVFILLYFIVHLFQDCFVYWGKGVSWNSISNNLHLA